MENRQIIRIALILLGFLILMTMMNTCNSCSTKRELSNVEAKVDSLDSLASKADIEKLVKNINLSIQIEGLKSEHRMIQATDRKIFDVNRQNEIEKEIENLKAQQK